MSETSVLKASTFPLNTNLQAIEQDAVGKYPFVFLLESETANKLLKLNANLKALGKDPIDTNQVINEALASTLDGLLSKHVHPHDQRDYYVPQHYLHPQVGDNWNEMGVSYLTVHEVIDDNDFIVHTHPSKIAGLTPGVYRINRQWLAHMVGYNGKQLFERDPADLKASDFCPWVSRGSHYKPEQEAKRAEWYEQNKDQVQDIRHFAPADK